MDKNGLLHYNIFKPFENLVAFSTTKKSLKNTVPRFTGDHPEIFQNNRLQLAEILDLKENQLVFPRQTHTNYVADISATPQQEIDKTDALITNAPEICLCVQTADCVPILLFDPHKNVIAAIHAGWKGTISKIAEKAIQKMTAKYNSSPENIVASIGPSIGPEVYEVGNEVAEQAQKQIPLAGKTLHKKNNGKFHFDLWEANRQILLYSGLKSKNIEIIEKCSFMNQEHFFSARRDGVNTGRMVSGIMIRR